jgi:hypothetical protein
MQHNATFRQENFKDCVTGQKTDNNLCCNVIATFLNNLSWSRSMVVGCLVTRNGARRCLIYRWSSARQPYRSVDSLRRSQASLVAKLGGPEGIFAFATSRIAGYGIQRQVATAGHSCVVVAPTLIPGSQTALSKQTDGSR